MNEQERSKVALVIVLREAMRRLTAQIAFSHNRKDWGKTARISGQLNTTLVKALASREHSIDPADIFCYPRALNVTQLSASAAYADELRAALLRYWDDVESTQCLLSIYASMEESRVLAHQTVRYPLRWEAIDDVRRTHWAILSVPVLHSLARTFSSYGAYAQAAQCCERAFDLGSVDDNQRLASIARWSRLAEKVEPRDNDMVWLMQALKQVRRWDPEVFSTMESLGKLYVKSAPTAFGSVAYRAALLAITTRLSVDEPASQEPGPDSIDRLVSTRNQRLLSRMVAPAVSTGKDSFWRPEWTMVNFRVVDMVARRLVRWAILPSGMPSDTPICRIEKRA